MGADPQQKEPLQTGLQSDHGQRAFEKRDNRLTFNARHFRFISRGYPIVNPHVSASDNCDWNLLRAILFKLDRLHTAQNIKGRGYQLSGTARETGLSLREKGVGVLGEVLEFRT